MQPGHDQPPPAAEEFAGDETTYQSDAFRMQCMKVGGGAGRGETGPAGRRQSWTECRGARLHARLGHPAAASPQSLGTVQAARGPRAAGELGWW